MPLKVIQPEEHAPEPKKEEHSKPHPDTQHHKQADNKPDSHKRAEKPAAHHKTDSHKPHKPTHHKSSNDSDTPGSEKLAILLIAIVGLVILFNQFQITQVNGLLVSGGSIGGGGHLSGPSAGKGTTIEVADTGDVVNDVIAALLPTGLPEQYGTELGVSFDDPVNSLSTLAKLDRAIPTSSLTPEEMERYVAVTTQISCEFCCSAPSVADSQGRSLCGCSHAAAPRGLTKYIIKNHPDEWTNDEILWDLTRWKSMWYPRNMVEKGVALVSNGMELEASALNDRQLLSKLSTGNVGDIGSLPTMVGGC